MKTATCCFTGHRQLPPDRIEQIAKRLSDEVDNLIRQGVTDFISGGAVGFDQLAASLVLEKKKISRDVRLIFVLPCKNQDQFWADSHKLLYRQLLAKADDIIYIADEYTTGCLKKRNYMMVERSAYCICALLNSRSGTGQTVRYAKKKGLYIINVSPKL